jgi:hypothetical protein
MPLALVTPVFVCCNEGRSEAPLEATGREIELLQALGYVGWNEAISDQIGVTKHDREQASPGFTLYTDQTLPFAYLMDMGGRVLHTWNAPDETSHWHHAEALPSGDLIAIVQNKSVDRLRWDSGEVWRVALRAHHDLDIAPDGRIFVLLRRTTHTRFEKKMIRVIEDGIAILSPSGEVLQTIWLLEAVRPLLPLSRFERAADAQWFFLKGEERAAKLAELRAETSLSNKQLVKQAATAINLLHANSIEILDRDVPGLGDRSQILLSLRNVSRLVLLDAAGKRVEWSWGEGEISGQHQATVLDNDHILLFDNRMEHENWSRVIEVDPVEDEIVWSHPSDIPIREGFYSRERSGAQRLPNGNVLITVGEPGQILEVSRDHEVVWEWHNPALQEGQRAALYRAERLPIDYFEGSPRFENAPD